LKSGRKPRRSSSRARAWESPMEMSVSTVVGAAAAAKRRARSKSTAAAFVKVLPKSMSSASPKGHVLLFGSGVPIRRKLPNAGEHSAVRVSDAQGNIKNQGSRIQRSDGSRGGDGFSGWDRVQGGEVTQLRGTAAPAPTAWATSATRRRNVSPRTSKLGNMS